MLLLPTQFSEEPDNHYGKSLDDSLSIAPIHHVHGSLGKYSDFYQIHTQPEKTVARAAKSIKIVHEENSRYKPLVAANRAVDQAKKLLFIGFGFNAANMAKIRKFRRPLDIGRIREESIFGTHKGLLKPQWERICDKYYFHFLADRYGANNISLFINQLIH